MSERARPLLRGALLILLTAIIVIGLAGGDDRPPDRVQYLGSRIRCPVCTGESIADSPSETARAMMEIVSEQVVAGKTDAEILAFFEARYGDVILLDPPRRGANLLLWVLPALALGVGALLAAGQLRERAGRSL